MEPLVLRLKETEIVVEPGDRVTFGRDPSCRLPLDPTDRGISRLAGEVFGEDGTWWVVNRSSKRVLHIIDDAGLTSPLPVGREGWPTPRRAVTPPGLTVLVPGEVWTHELRLSVTGSAEDRQSHHMVDPRTTSTHLGGLSENRMEALVALVSGYLRPFPRYDPRPLTYAEAGELLGVPASTVRKRIEHVRAALVDAGVAGLTGDEAPRRLAEYLLATRIVGPDDLAWLDARREERSNA